MSEGLRGLGTVRVVWITDPRYDEARVLAVARAASHALPRGAFAVQLREKTDVARRERLASALHAELASTASALFVNGDLDLAARLGVSLHLPSAVSPDPQERAIVAARGRASSPEARVTVAAHDGAAVAGAIEAGADGALVSPVFETPGKGPARGLDAVREARAIADARPGSHGRLAVVALGGVDVDKVASAAAAGADAVAVLRALGDAADPGAVARSLFAPFAVR